MKKITLIVISILLLNVSCKKDTSSGSSATITALSCSSGSFSATATASTAYTATATVPYTGGNGVAYTAGVAITSTGVTGLTATLQASTLASGNGNLSYSVSGTPASTGPITLGPIPCNNFSIHQCQGLIS